MIPRADRVFSGSFPGERFACLVRRQSPDLLRKQGPAATCLALSNSPRYILLKSQRHAVWSFETYCAIYTSPLWDIYTTSERKGTRSDGAYPPTITPNRRHSSSPRVEDVCLLLRDDVQESNRAGGSPCDKGTRKTEKTCQKLSEALQARRGAACSACQRRVCVRVKEGVPSRQPDEAEGTITRKFSPTLTLARLARLLLTPPPPDWHTWKVWRSLTMCLLSLLTSGGRLSSLLILSHLGRVPEGLG